MATHSPNSINHKTRKLGTRTSAAAAAALLLAVQMVTACTESDRLIEESIVDDMEALEQSLYVDPDGREIDPAKVDILSSSLKYTGADRLLAPNWQGASMATFGGRCTDGKTRSFFIWAHSWGNLWCNAAQWASNDQHDCTVKTAMQASGESAWNDGQCVMMIYER